MFRTTRHVEFIVCALPQLNCPVLSIGLRQTRHGNVSKLLS